MLQKFNPGQHADPLLEHATHHIAQTGKTCSLDLARALGIDAFRAAKIIIALDWRGGNAGGVAA